MTSPRARNHSPSAKCVLKNDRVQRACNQPHVSISRTGHLRKVTTWNGSLSLVYIIYENTPRDGPQKGRQMARRKKSCHDKAMDQLNSYALTQATILHSAGLTCVFLYEPDISEKIVLGVLPIWRWDPNMLVCWWFNLKLDFSLKIAGLLFEVTTRANYFWLNC